MSGRALCKMMLVAVAGVLLSIPPTQVQTCNGTAVLASADEATGPGQITGGSYLDTRTSNNVREAFSETRVNGVSRLNHRWRFDNVPPGHISIIREGFRLATPDGDNFRFRGWYDTPGGPFFSFGNICPITSSFDL